MDLTDPDAHATTPLLIFNEKLIARDEMSEKGLLLSGIRDHTVSFTRLFFIHDRAKERIRAG